MFALVLIGVFISALIICIIGLLIKNHDLEVDNLKLSHQTTLLLKENSKLRKELIKSVY